ncbi:MAG: glycine cleavage system protein GcvH [Spirochaetales bacterium]|nr:glycine cleavage system protein GcvH [Spirochaetales bacterium]
MEIRYAKTHEWAAKEGDLYICGLSDYAQEKVGDIVFVELPETGAAVEQGAPFGVIESVKAANDLYSPLSGEVAAVNEALEDEPELVNSSPLKDGWICKIKSDDASFSALMSEDEYKEYLKGQDD